MIVTADASFLVSLYGVDVNSPAARAWMQSHPTPVILTAALRFETENALRLAKFRGLIGELELLQALDEIEADLRVGILTLKNAPDGTLWAECRRLSAMQTEALGTRTYDITHVASALLLGANTFLTFDRRQASLAEAVGLTVVP